jgi:hypothetical protein
MAGLLDTNNGTTMSVGPASSPDASASPPAATPTPDSGQDQASDTDEDGQQPNVTPEEQQQYDQFVTNGLHVIYGANAPQDQGEQDQTGQAAPTARPDILNRLKEGADPIEALAHTTAWLVTMLETSAEKNGHQLDDAVVLHGGQAMLQELAEVADAAKIHDYSEKEMEGAWYKGLDLYRETATKQGRIDPEQLKQQFNEIQQADSQGRMGDVLPQLGGQSGGQTPTPPTAAPQASPAGNQGG